MRCPRLDPLHPVALMVRGLASRSWFLPNASFSARASVFGTTVALHRFFDGMAKASTMRGKVLRGLAKHRFAQEDNEPVHVLDNVWIGSIGAASNAGALRRKGWALCAHAQKRTSSERAK